MKNTLFLDKIAKGYAKSKIMDIKSYERKLEKTQEYLSKNMRLLEVGCGTGMTACLHAPHVKHVHATDISPAMVEIAKNRAMTDNIANISFEVCSTSTLSVEDESQDVILAMSLLHLIENPTDALGELRKKLKPGGLFISSTICLGDKMKLLRFILPLMRLVGFAPDIVHFFEKDKLLDIIQRQGFSIEYKWQPSEKAALFIIARKH